MNWSHSDMPHLLWDWTTSDPRDVCQACIKAKMLPGAYILQKKRKAFNQTDDTTCPLCRDSEEDMAHFLIFCRHTRDGRDPCLKATLSHIPLVFKDHPHNWNAQKLAHMALNPSYPTVGLKPLIGCSVFSDWTGLLLPLPMASPVQSV